MKTTFTRPLVKKARKILKRWNPSKEYEVGEDETWDERQELVHQVIGIWYPAVLACINDHGDSWSHYNDLDVDVEDVLFGK